VVPVNRGHVGEEALLDGVAVLAEGGHRPLEIDRIPQDDRRDHQIQATRPVPLLVIGAIAEFPQRLKQTARAKVFRASPLFRPALSGT
jgi:hypothetical protein